MPTLNGNTFVIARWVTVAFAGLGLAYGYGGLNERVDSLEDRAANNRALTVSIIELTGRMGSLEKEVERMRMSFERSQNGATPYRGAQ